MNMQTSNQNEDKMMANSNVKEDSLKDKIGNAVEKVGHKISDAGAPNLGQKIHDMGDAMEKDHKNPSHPHKV